MCVDSLTLRCHKPDLLVLGPARLPGLPQFKEGHFGIGPKYARRESNNLEKARENQGISVPSGTDSGTSADVSGLEALGAALRALSPEDRAQLVAILTGEKFERMDG